MLIWEVIHAIASERVCKWSITNGSLSIGCIGEKIL
jgi:hypothetical protein